MDINKKNYDDIIKMIKDVNKNKIYEFEARICNKKNSKVSKLDYYKYKTILNSLIFSKDNGGYNYKDYSIETFLDIKVDDYRLTIMDKDSVKMYWLLEDLTDKINYKIIKKKNINKLDLDDYNIRLSLSTEEKLDNNITGNILDLLKDKTKTKNYRLKNRYSIKTPDGMFQFDLTSIKMADGVSFKKSNVFKSLTNYEAEVEYIGNEMDDKKVYNNLFKYIKILLLLYQDTDNIIKKGECDEVLNTYKKLISYNNGNNGNNYNPLFIVANPVTLQKNNLVKNSQININNNYAVSLKADGIRNLLYVLDSNDKDLYGKIYLIDSNLNIKYTGIKNSLYAGSLIEGEYIKTDNLFLCYDMLYEKGDDIRKLLLIDNKSSRVGKLQLFLKSFDKQDNMSKLLIKNKEYKYEGDIYENINELWSNRANYEYDVDGLILTPINEEYPKKAGTWNKLFKWKPSNYNSFDFLVKVDKNEKEDDIKSPYIIYKENGDSEVYQYKTLILYIGKLEYNNKTNKRTYNPVEFNPMNESDEESKKINRAKIVLDRNMKMMSKDPITNQYDEIIDDTIVEFVYNKNNEFPWTPIRVRHDKTEQYKSGKTIYGNNEITANNIWRSVINPLEFNELILGSIDKGDISMEDNSYYVNKEYEPNKRLPYQNFHNLIVKKNLINEVSVKKGGSLLDTSCGKGGDLNKWVSSKYKKVIGIDVDESGLKYAKSYYDNFNKDKPEVVYIWGDTSKLIFPNYEAALDINAKKSMKDNMPSKYSFDVISSQFTLHYYFESELKLRGFMQNVADNLKVGGYFVGTCFDGRRIMDALKNKNSIEGKKDDEIIWKIDKLYKGAVFNSNRSQYNKNIDVYVSSIGATHTESLVDFVFLDTILKEYGLEKVKVIEFSKIYEDMDKTDEVGKSSMMSDDEKDFSFLNNAFIYKKVKNTPDSVYKRYQTLIKSDKTSGDKKIKLKKI